MESLPAVGRLDALVLKLRHPLAKIRFRSLYALLFKLQERLVCWQELEPLQNVLIPALLANLEPPLELKTLHVLQLLLQSQSEIFVASLQHHGAAQKFQRAANANLELQSTYEKLLSQIYTMKCASMDSKNNEQATIPDDIPKAKVNQLIINTVVSTPAPKVEVLEARGWRFAQVALVPVDDQFLFEFEVKIQLRTEIQEIVAACAMFRNEVLRNFPAEVFLQRPIILQYLLHLIQQPILPERSPPRITQKGSDDTIEGAMAVAMGVNYFDEVLNETFAARRRNFTGAVIMASLKAIESFLYALKLSTQICLDPAYVVYAPTKPMEERLDTDNTRRVMYPRVKEAESKNCRLEQLSLSGAIYKIFLNFLPLLRSARHPRLHLLNLLCFALPDLPEKSFKDLISESNMQELNSLRLEHILDMLSGICRPVMQDQSRWIMVDKELELTVSMTWKLVELVLRLLRLYPPSQYYVEGIETKAESSKKGMKIREKGHIKIPQALWEAVKSWVANPVFLKLATRDWKDESIAEELSQIDATIPAFIKLKNSSRQDAKLILKFISYAEAHREQLLNFCSCERAAILTLCIAKKTIQARWAFSDKKVQAIADATLLTIWFALTLKDDKVPIEEDFDTIQYILCELLSGKDRNQASKPHNTMKFYFFRGLNTLVESISTDNVLRSSDSRYQLLSKALCGPKVLTLVLLELAKNNDEVGDEADFAVFWILLRTTLHQLAGSFSDKVAHLEPVVPLLQHFAYIELSEDSSHEQRLTQPHLAKVLNQIETNVPDNRRILLISRCLLHVSSHIRKAASFKILRLLAQISPSCAEWISKYEEIRDDPFYETFAHNDKQVNLETSLLEVPLPVSQASMYHPSESELSSQLSKLSHLVHVISKTTLSFDGMKEAALKELIVFIEMASVEMFRLLEELNKLTELMDLLRGMLQIKAGQEHSSIIQYSLLLLRTLLLRSRLLRSAIQHASDFMTLLLPFIFHPSASIRALMYYIILLLTCSADNFIPNRVPVDLTNNALATTNEDAKVPDLLKSSFGLYSSRWTRCCLVTCSLQKIQAHFDVATKETDTMWLQEVQKIIHETPMSYQSDKEKLEDMHSRELNAILEAEYAVVAQKLRDAPSHGMCLNALYHMMMMCRACRFNRDCFIKDWEVNFERFFAKPPKSERDEVILGAILSTLSVIIGNLTRAEQLRILVVVKRRVLPLLKRSESICFSLQVARLLLNLSESNIHDLFLSLAADTDIISTICLKYSTMYATEPSLHGLMLEILLRFARGMNDKAVPCLSPPSRAKICKRLSEMLSPLLTIVCHHRIPGSFQGRNVFAIASQCMIEILRTLPHDSLLASDIPLQHTDSRLLLDGSWATRFLFDHVSHIRELGFYANVQTASSNVPSVRVVEMALETSYDVLESDAVRAAACTVVTQEILRYHERPPDDQAAFFTTLHGSAFTENLLRLFSGLFKGDKLLVRATSAFTRQVRVLYVQKDRLIAHVGNMQEELKKADRNVGIYTLLIQALSLREWKDKCNRFSSSFMHLFVCDEHAWRRTLLPAIFDTLVELLHLLQNICRDGGSEQATFFLLHTILQYQLVQLIQDVYVSIDDTLSLALRRRHYEVLDLSAGTLGILLVQVCNGINDTGSKELDTPISSSFGAELMTTVTNLLSSQHPIEFRVSISRIIAATPLLISISIDWSNTLVINALSCAVFDLYEEVAAFSPRADSTCKSDVQDRAFPLASIRRVACALQILVETNSAAQSLVQLKREIPFALGIIKDSFSAIRIAGGFGGKRGKHTNSSFSSLDAYVHDLCGRIQIHMDVVSSIIGGNEECQRMAKDEGLLRVILSNWNFMKTAHVHGSQVMLRALCLVANYIYGNDNAQVSLLISLPSGSSTLLSLLFDLVSQRSAVRWQGTHRDRAVSEADLALSNAACQVLKAALVNVECVSPSIKTGLITKLLHSLQDRIKQARQTSKTNQLEKKNLAFVLGVLCSIASTEEGARFLYTSLAGTALSLMFDDILHLLDMAIQRNGFLFLRNLSLSRVTKIHFAMWKELLDPIINLYIHASDSNNVDSIAYEYLSIALWALVYDNQKARALMLSKPATLQSLKRILSSQTCGKLFSADTMKNLQRALLLIEARS